MAPVFAIAPDDVRCLAVSARPAERFFEPEPLFVNKTPDLNVVRLHAKFGEQVCDKPAKCKVADGPCDQLVAQCTDQQTSFMPGDLRWRHTARLALAANPFDRAALRNAKP